MKTTDSESKPAAVPERAKQAGDTRPVNRQWVERSVWTQRMLEALEQGVKGYFQDNGLFSLVEAHRTWLQPSRR